MKLSLEMPRQRTTAPILAIAIILGLLLSPFVDRALAHWMPEPVPQPATEHPHDGSTWDMRSMWN
jgi:hypothetical protein